MDKKKFNPLENLKLTLSFDDVLIQPKFSDVLPSEVDISIQLNEEISLKIPVISAAMDTITEYEMARSMIKAGGIGPLHKNLSYTDISETLKKLFDEFGGNKPYAVSVGIDTPKEYIDDWIKICCNIIVIDSAHGHSKNVGDMLTYLRNKYPKLFIIAGNVVTKEGANFLIKQGANAIKVGIGPGSICTTRKVTGVGVGQLTAIADVAEICKQHNVLTISDGGMKSLDDIVKSIAAGANLVMLGYMFAGTDECPGDELIMDGQKYKLYRGMGCINAMKEGSASRYNQNLTHPTKWISEGVEGYVKSKGPISKIIDKIEWGIKTGLGYIGAKNIYDFHEKAEFVQITNSVLKKSEVCHIDRLLSDK